MPWWSTREHAVVHRGEDRVGAAAVAGDLGQPPLQLVGRLVDDARQLAELVARAARGCARARLPAASCARRVHDLGERAAERAESRSERRAPSATSASRPATPRCASSSRRPAPGSRSAPRLTRTTPTTVPAWRIGTADVEQVARRPWRCVARRAWRRPARAPSPPGRPAWFSTGAQLGAGGGGVGEHAAVRRDRS